MKKILRAFAVSIAIFSIAISLFSCQKTDKRYVLDGFVQGTYYHIVFYAKDTTSVKQDIKKIFQDIDMSLSLWVDSSTVNKVNRNEDVVLDDIFVENFVLAQNFSRLTEGMFDITIGELVKKYGFANKNREKLSDEQVDSLLQYVGYKNVSLKDNKVVKKYTQTSLDFNAIAQGYTSDTIAKYFKKRGINSFVVDIGGEVMCGDKKPDGAKWVIGIERPNNSLSQNMEVSNQMERATEQTISLENESVVTSGNYRKFYVENGVRYSHTINPKTGKPVTHSLLSASVIAKDATTADALATAFMVMGLDEAKRFLENHKQYAAYLIYSDRANQMQIWMSENFRRYINNK